MTRAAVQRRIFIWAQGYCGSWRGEKLYYPPFHYQLTPLNERLNAGYGVQRTNVFCGGITGGCACESCGWLEWGRWLAFLHTLELGAHSDH